MRDGEVWVTEFNRLKPLRDSWRIRLYVDPRTGILRRNKHYKHWTQEPRERLHAEAGERAQRMREFGPFVQVHFLKECWWEVTLAPTPPDYATWSDSPAFGDVVIGSGLSRLPPNDLYGRRGVYAVKRRQLNSAEIVRLGLKTT